MTDIVSISYLPIAYLFEIQAITSNTDRMIDKIKKIIYVQIPAWADTLLVTYGGLS